ncbi:MAG: GYF domain-containing protein [Luteolibacter sp.]
MDQTPPRPDFFPPSTDDGAAFSGRSSRDSAPWYYTHAGERQGPVPYGELREKAKNGTLNPRFDLVWTKGMAEWAAAGSIPDLFERVEIPETSIAVSEPIADPYQAPAAQDTSQSSYQNQWPGARRRSFLFVTLLLPLIVPPVLERAIPLLPLPAEQLLWLRLGVLVLLIFLCLAYTLQRLTNLDMSRWWFFAGFVPILNLWLGYRCFACPAGYAAHKKMDGAGIFLAIVYWLFIAASVLLLVTSAVLAAGLIDSPEIQQQLREILSQARTPNIPPTSP